MWAAVFEAGDRGDVSTGRRPSSPAGWSTTTRTSSGCPCRGACSPLKGAGLDIRQTRRLVHDRPGARAASRAPRPESPAYEGALWARSDKQATLLLTMAVQQGMTTAEPVRRAAPRRSSATVAAMLVTAVVTDLLGGVRSLGELDFAHECRRRGIPEPDRQAGRPAGRDGRYYLDVCWERLRRRGRDRRHPPRVGDQRRRRTRCARTRSASDSVDRAAAAAARPPGGRGRLLRPDRARRCVRRGGVGACVRTSWRWPLGDHSP